MQKFILRIDAYDGDTTSVTLFNEGEAVDTLFVVVGITPGGAGILDSGYRSFAEAKAAWPEAI
jgi:hypothetical protein